MLAAMQAAAVGDDVFGEDPSVNALETRIAQHFGMEAALYCPSGTMCNQIAVRVATRPGDELITYLHGHVYRYEGGGPAANAGVSCCLLAGDRGRLSAAEVEAAINSPDDPHLARTRMVCLENTANKGGGACYELDALRGIRNLCDRQGLHLHVDGARIFNALVATGQQARDWGACCDSLSVCFSKGLGAPVGSALLGSAAFIREARRVRKMMGGGMRQAGYLAAACLYALDHHVARLAEDHQHARRIAAALQAQPWVDEILPVETNIVIVHTRPAPAAVLAALGAAGIRAVPFGPQALRFVTHLDFSTEMAAEFEQRLLQVQI